MVGGLRGSKLNSLDYKFIYLSDIYSINSKKLVIADFLLSYHKTLSRQSTVALTKKNYRILSSIGSTASPRSALSMQLHWFYVMQP